MEYSVPSVALAAQALKLLSRHKYRFSSLKVIATKLDASPTTCLRILRSLEREDFVRYDRETRKYGLGPYLIPLGNRAAELNDAFARASAEIKRVAAQTGLITALVQRWDDLPVFIASAEPPADEKGAVQDQCGRPARPNDARPRSPGSVASPWCRRTARW